METPLMEMKPNILNALFPVFLKNLFFSFIVILVMYAVSQVLTIFGVISLTASDVTIWLIGILFLFAIAPMTVRIIILYNTKYYFFRTHVISEFEFIMIKKYSLPYSKISNITVDISIWDRFCRAGDVTLHTAENITPDLVLRFIKNPKKMERDIYRMIDTQRHDTHYKQTHKKHPKHHG
jgi:hypothetical protein